MNGSYRPGILIVVATVLASLAVCVSVVKPRPAGSRAAEDLGSEGFPVGSFRLTERSGRTVTEADLAERPAVVSFIFTRCPLSCPRITSLMKGLQGKLTGTQVRLVSVSVDPAHDTPAVLADYARRFGAVEDRWWFLTGPTAEVKELVTGRFKLGLQTASEADRQAGAEAVSHSDRLALVVGGKVVGYSDSNDPRQVEALLARARSLDRQTALPGWVRRLPAVNATLNGSCALILALGWFAVRGGNVRAHAACMISAVAVSSAFLGCYLLYHFHAGSVAFQGVGAVRLTYYTVLLSHTLLATFGVVPLVTWTLVRALQRRFDRHARIARVTFPIWMYVSLTGVLIYWMLYQMPGGSTPY